MPASYFALKNLQDEAATTLSGAPWTAAIPPRPGLDPTASKADYRAWCSQASTDWVFYNMAEGLTPGLRVNNMNPVKFQHGIVADYDAIMDRAAVLEILNNNCPDGLLPTAISTTFSGGVRLVWEFEEPLLLDHKVIYEGFMAHAIKTLRADKILPHYDATSTKPSQYFEIGSDWDRITDGAPLPTDTLHLWLAESALKAKKLGTETTLIPYERIAAEIEKQYPNRLAGMDIKEGLRVPLFWIPDGIDRIGAVLGERGVICFSDRAGKSFVAWDEILGKKFVQEYEAERTGAACADFWWDGASYWTSSDGAGGWERIKVEELARRLRVLYGLSSKQGSKDTASEIDKAMVAIQQTKSVQSVAPFIYNPQTIVEYNGRKCLNISGRRMMEPADHDGGFPWLHRFLVRPGIWDGTTDENGVDQGDYFLAWLKRFWESGREGRLSSGQIMFIAGLAGQGKTFLSSFIMGQISGGHGDASGYLLGGGAFNKELVEVGVWSVDDGLATVDGPSRRVFGANLKKVVAQTDINYHPKFLDAVKLPWQGRVIVTCNTDPESLSIVPQTDNSITDKLMLLKLGEWYPDFPPNAVIEAMVRAELPYFLRWLSQWEPPASIVDRNRYGVKSFHHPEILTHSQSLSAASHICEDLDSLRKDDAFISKGEKFWEGTASDLMRAGRDFFATRSTAVQLGVWLSQIEKSGAAPWLGRREGRARKTLWRIEREG